MPLTVLPRFEVADAAGAALERQAQHLKQLDERVQQAILGTVGTLIVFRVGVRDAKVLADELFPEFKE